MNTISPSVSEFGAINENFDRESTVASSDGPFTDAACNTGTETIDLISDSQSSFGDDQNMDRKPSPAPSFASDGSIEVVDFIQRGPPPPAFFEDEKPAFEDMKPALEETKPRTLRNRPSGPIQRLTEAMQAQIVSLREAGWTIDQIAEHIDRSRSTVNSFIQRRKKRIQALIGELPGSRPPRPPAVAGAKRGVKEEDIKPFMNAPGPSQRRKVAKRETNHAPGFDFETDDLLDVKPTVRAKKEDPL
ncbi:hypothetical protein NDA16_001425 [Ustilago loliicola]|nr:hypothetical protein NDA16_001425 [Ustilago loliicola]